MNGEEGDNSSPFFVLFRARAPSGQHGQHSWFKLLLFSEPSVSLWRNPAPHCASVISRWPVPASAVSNGGENAGVMGTGIWERNIAMRLRMLRGLSVCVMLLGALG